MKLDFHPEADAEFAAQIAYYEETEGGLGLRFYREVMASMEWITQNPYLPRLRKSYRRLNLKVFRFYIAYTVEEDLIWILAVAHSSKRPGYWRGRRKKNY